MRSQLACLFVIITFSTGCDQVPEPSIGAGEPPAVTFAVYVAASVPGNDLLNEQIGPNGYAVYLDRAPLVTTEHIRHVSRAKGSDGGPAFLIELTGQGAEAMRSASDRYLDGQLAVVVNGEVLCAPFVHAVMSDKLLITGASGGLNSEQVDSLIAELNDAASGSG